MSARKPSKSRPPSGAPLDESSEGVEPTSEPGNGALETESGTETALATEEPAQVELKIKGSDKSARAAAKRFGEGAQAKPLPVATPSNDEEPPPDDPIAALLADGKNMVIVTRQTPRNIRDHRGQKIVTNVRLPGRYTCPTSISAIEEQVFNEHWGSTYKCTIHPDTSTGENQILGHFKIEHPDPKAPPFVEGVTDVDQPAEEAGIPITGDPTLRETDDLADVRLRLKRRLERAETMKEIRETERLVKQAERDLENDGKPPAPIAPVGESDEIRKLREELAKTQAQLAEKKVNDRFDKLEGSITELTKAIASIATAKPTTSENDIIMKMMTQSQQHSKDMLTLIQEKGKPVAPASNEGDLDKFLDRVTKLQAITGTSSKGSGRLSSLEEKLIDMSFDRLTNGGDGDDGEGEGEIEDAVKLAIKQFAPIAKTYVEKKMDQESAASGGVPIPEEQRKMIYAEAATVAAKKVQEDLALQGLQLVEDPNTKKLVVMSLPAPAAAPKKALIPQRHPAPGKIVSQHRTSEGVVKQLRIEPADLSKKPVQPRAEAASVPSPQKEEEEVKYAEFPGLGEGGAVLKVALPFLPEDVRYDRRYSVNFILDSIRSEIRQGIPKKAPDDSFVVGDALDLLDPEVLERISQAETGPQVETIFAEWGDRVKVDEIKAAGSEEAVETWLRRLIKTVGDKFRLRTAQGK
jgi:hypothetical protein